MRTVRITDATASLAQYARELDGPLVVTARGRPVAALLPVEGMDLETLAVGTSPKFLEIIERSRRRQEAEGSVSPEEMRARLGLEPKSPPKGKHRATKRNHRAKKHGSQV